MRRLDCLRCGTQMQFLLREKFQKGESGPWVGNLNFNFRGGFDMEVYNCPRCGKLEFFLPDVDPDREPEVDAAIDDLPPEAEQGIVGVSMDGIPQVRCPRCGRRHDFDYPKCPYCENEY